MYRHIIYKHHAGPAPLPQAPVRPWKMILCLTCLASSLFWVPLVPLYNRPRLQSLTPTCNLPEQSKSNHYWEKAYSRGHQNRKIVTDNRYTWRVQKNTSPICPDLVSVAPNDDARNKNASLVVGKRSDLWAKKIRWQNCLWGRHCFCHTSDYSEIVVRHCSCCRHASGRSTDVCCWVLG
jgi:hypothetical protein